MNLQEGVDYTRTGWREGEEATLENRPRLTLDMDAWNAAADKESWNLQWRDLYDNTIIAYEAALSPEQKAERSRHLEAEMMEAARSFYVSRAPGDNRSFWD